MLGSKRQCSSVLPMSAAPTSDTEKNPETGAGGVITISICNFIDNTIVCILVIYLRYYKMNLFSAEKGILQ